MVSMPSDSGFTSSSSRPSSPPRGCRPAHRPGWQRPARRPGRGRCRCSGSRPKCRRTASRTGGMRVEPPTSTTPSTSAALSLASRSARRNGAIVRSTRSRVRVVERARGRPTGSARRRCRAHIAAASPRPLVSASLAARAAACSAPGSAAPQSPPVFGGRTTPPARWSKSSPPSCASPPVAMHLEDAARQAQHRHVEGAAAQVVDHVDALLGRVEPVGDGCRGGLVQQAQHVQAGELRRRPWWPGAGRRRSRPAR